MELQVITPDGGSRDVALPYEALVRALGISSFYASMASAIRDIVPLDRIYFFTVAGPRAVDLQLAEYETTQAPTRHEVYVSDYMPVDPILSAIKRAVEPRTLALLRVSPRDIKQPRYRMALRSADIVERISIVRRNQRNWQCLNLARRSGKGPFCSDELLRLADFARLALPLAARHDEIVETSRRAISVDQLEARFAALKRGLSARETEVCARAVFGMSVEGTALDLGLGQASVLTYRKRAYGRLEVSSVNELSKLVMS